MLSNWLKDYEDFCEVNRKPSERILPLGYDMIEAKRRKLLEEKKVGGDQIPDR